MTTTILSGYRDYERHIDKPNGFVLHRGYVGGEAYTVIVTGVERESENDKTGPMLQVFIILDSLNPVDVVRSGLDATTICRGCPFSSGRGCYVTVGQSVLAVFIAHQKGSYPDLMPKDYAIVFEGRTVRFGAYGNPTLIPLSKVRAIARICSGWTGYFHDWREHRFAKQYAEFFMASTETTDSYRLARSLGYRSFHANPVQPAGTRECLATAKGLTCERCKLCAGLSKKQQPDIWVPPHGSRLNRALEAISSSS